MPTRVASLCQYCKPLSLLQPLVKKSSRTYLVPEIGHLSGVALSGMVAPVNGTIGVSLSDAISLEAHTAARVVRVPVCAFACVAISSTLGSVTACKIHVWMRTSYIREREVIISLIGYRDFRVTDLKSRRRLPSPGLKGLWPFWHRQSERVLM